MEHPEPDPVRARFPRVLITGAGGQLGTALAEVFPWADAPNRLQLDVELPLTNLYRPAPDLVLHCAAWTNVDLAEQPDGIAAVGGVNIVGTRNAVELGAPVVYYSTDYVFDGTKREPYVESDRTNPTSVYGQTKLQGEQEIGDGWIVRTSWLFGWTGQNFVRTMLRLGRERDEVAVVDDQRGCPTYVGHLAAATRDVLDLPHGPAYEDRIYHVAAAGDCTWADFAEAIFSEAGLDCRVRRITSQELDRPAPRPAYSVLRSERGAPTLPHWRDGLRACLERLASADRGVV